MTTVGVADLSPDRRPAVVQVARLLIGLVLCVVALVELLLRFGLVILLTICTVTLALFALHVRDELGEVLRPACFAYAERLLR